MAKASKKKIGAGSLGKNDGSGAMTVLKEGLLPENMVLSNRDKALHSAERGLDSRRVQTEQYQDHVGARRDFHADEFVQGARAEGADGGDISPDEIRARAYQLWEEEGHLPHRDPAHWLQAEYELRKRAEKKE